MSRRLWAIKVTGRLSGAGAYVPLGPVGEGDYYSDKYVTCIITAATVKAAKEVFKKVYPSADRIKANRLMTVD